mgnify:CR=1 FL=1
MSYDQTYFKNERKRASISFFLVDFVMRLFTPVLMGSYIIASLYILFLNLPNAMKSMPIDKYATSDFFKLDIMERMDRMDYVIALGVISALLYLALVLRDDENFNAIAPWPISLLASIANFLSIAVILLFGGVLIIGMGFLPVLMSVISGVVGMDFVPSIPFVLPWVIIYAASASKQVTDIRMED